MFVVVAISWHGIDEVARVNSKGIAEAVAAQQKHECPECDVFVRKVPWIK